MIRGVCSACPPAAYEVSCRIRAGSPRGLRPHSPRTVASRRLGSPVPRRRGLGWQAATCGGEGQSMARRADVNSIDDARPAGWNDPEVAVLSFRAAVSALPDAQVAQLVEQRTENPRVGGSIPSLGTTSNSLSYPQLPHCPSTIWVGFACSDLRNPQPWPSLFPAGVRG